jgi:hypothetical protein
MDKLSEPEKILYLKYSSHLYTCQINFFLYKSSLQSPLERAEFAKEKALCISL